MPDTQTLLPIAPSTAVMDADVLDAHSEPNRADRILTTLQRWHDEAHAGPFQHCYEQPCHATQRANDEGRDLCRVCSDVLVCPGCDFGPEVQVEG